VTGRMMIEAKFETDDTVRFIGTDALFTITKCRRRMHEYQIQRGDKTTDRQWVAEIYLELVQLTSPTRPAYSYRSGLQAVAD
jgi:hypothetical protein